MFRKDPCGAWIVWNKYGLRDNDYGWEIDHVYPKSLGGGEEFENLRAMNWRNNDSKSDDYPSYIAMAYIGSLLEKQDDDGSYND